MQAVTKDSEGKFGQAINFYTQALEYFIPALECEYFFSSCIPIGLPIYFS